MRDLFGDLVVGKVVQGGRPDFDVIGDRSYAGDALGCSHGYVLLVVPHDVATEGDRPVVRDYGNVLRGDLRIAFQLLHDRVAEDPVADYLLHRFTPSNEMRTTGLARDRAALFSKAAAASAALTASARVDTLTVRLRLARPGTPSVVCHLAETLTSSGSSPARRNLRADHAKSEASAATRRSSGVGASRRSVGSASSSRWPRMLARKPSPSLVGR